MITLWSDVPRFRRMAELRGEMDRLFEAVARGGERPLFRAETTSPPVNLYDTGEALVVEAQLPGVKLEDIEVTAQRDVLRISGKREVVLPEGFKTHRAERRSFTFTRAFALNAKCDLDKVTASAVNGVLTITLPKAPEAKPRKISVKAD